VLSVYVWYMCCVLCVCVYVCCVCVYVCVFHSHSHSPLSTGLWTRFQTGELGSVPVFQCSTLIEISSKLKKSADFYTHSLKIFIGKNDEEL